MTNQTIFKTRQATVGIDGISDLFPVHRIYCVGQNYAAHAIEMGSDPDKQSPFFFTKPADAVIQSSQVPYPSQTSSLHHEVECVVAIGQSGSEVDARQAEEMIYGYTVGIDLTRRDIQSIAKQKGRPWDVAKGFDNSAPLANLVTKAHWNFDTEADIQLEVNGVIRQQAKLNHLIWSIPELISELSKYYHLQPGDLIFTGTPSGVAALVPGDKVKATIHGLAELNIEIIA